MQPDPNTPPFNDPLQSGTVPPLLSASPRPVIGTPPPSDAGSPPPPPPEPARKSGPRRRWLAILLSLCLGLFLADGIVSLVDDSLILLFDIHLLTMVRGIVFLFAVLIAVAVFGLMALTPMIPKRLFLPVILFNAAASLAIIPFAIYCYSLLQQVSWVVSFCQVIFGLTILCMVQG